MVLVPSQQQHLWTNLTIANTHLSTQDTHHSIITESIIPIYHQQDTIQLRYTIDYDKQDTYRLQAYTERMTDPIRATIIDIQETYLRRNIQNRRRIEKAIEIFQDVQNGNHHIVSLLMFGIKRITNMTSLKNKYNNIEEVQTIINNNAMDNTEKTQQLQKIITECQEQQKQKKKLRHQQETTLSMFNNYSKHKQHAKNQCHDAIKINTGETMPIEKGYSHYLTNILMKPIEQTPP